MVIEDKESNVTTACQKSRNHTLKTGHSTDINAVDGIYVLTCPILNCEHFKLVFVL